MLKIGTQLRALRLQRGFCQEYLAHELNMTQGNYCKLESDHHFPSAAALEKLISVYGIPAQELISESKKQIQDSDPEHSVKTVIVSQDAQKLVDELLTAKEKIIDLQAKHIELLETKLRNLDHL